MIDISCILCALWVNTGFLSGPPWAISERREREKVEKELADDKSRDRRIRIVWAEEKQI